MPQEPSVDWQSCAYQKRRIHWRMITENSMRMVWRRQKNEEKREREEIGREEREGDGEGEIFYLVVIESTQE